MEVFTIDLTLNLKLPLVVLTHVTTRSSKSTDSSIMNLLHTNTPVCDFEISTQRFSLSIVVDLVVATYLHRYLCLDLFFFLVNACWVRRLQNLTNLIGVTHKTWKMCIRVSLWYLAVLNSNPEHFTGFWVWFKICKIRVSISQSSLLIGWAR